MSSEIRREQSVEQGEQFRLAKSLGVLAIGASALTHEYGATINYVSTNSLGVYPGIQQHHARRKT